jgi:PTS system nitrogen regulatory IIA component
MNIADTLKVSCISLHSKSNNSDEILAEAAKLAVNTGLTGTITENTIFNELKKREKLSSTGFGKGIAIPHCALEGVDTFILGIISASTGIEFDAIDNKPVNLFFFIIGPKDKRNEHIRLLSEISNIVKHDTNVEKLLTASGPDEMKQRFLSHLKEDKSTSPQLGDAMCQFIVHIQNQDYFDDILEILTSEVEGSLSVIDSTNAGYYLNKMPLFSSYWTDSNQRFSRILIAVTKKAAMNDVIRRISTVVPLLYDQSGVLITVQDLTYTIGSIDF